TAVSIAAEIIACQWGGGGRPLAQLGGRIHHEWGSDVGKRGSDYGSDPELSDSLTRY
ncbi:XshC-Cox1 family protein, partial [Mycolicibacterium agri]